jgi:hypothetical protein
MCNPEETKGKKGRLRIIEIDMALNKNPSAFKASYFDHECDS